MEDVLDVKCPENCNSRINENEIKKTLDKACSEKYIRKTVEQTELLVKNRFHCLTSDCIGYCIIENETNTNENSLFECPVCRNTNCIKCTKLIDESLKNNHMCDLSNSKNNENDPMEVCKDYFKMKLFFYV